MGRQPTIRRPLQRTVRILLECILVNYYRPQRSWGKVIFSQASVILSTGGSASVHAGIPPPCPRDQVGTLLPGAEHTGRYGQRAGGMPPTGMQSC